MKLIVQPEGGITPVLRAIKQAKQRVDLAIFRTDRKEIEKALAAAVERGVRVRVLVAHTNHGGENRLRKLERRLLEVGVTVARTGDDFLRYHGKYMIADDTLHVFTFNFTRADTRKSRGFGVSTRDKGTLKQALELFEADCTRQSFAPNSGCLVVSPENARDSLTAFIKAAKRQLLIYDVNLQDSSFIQLLKARSAAGVDVRIIGKAKGSGLDVRGLATMRLHARAIVRDGSKVFVGSQSLRRPELNLRREVGVCISNASVARQLRDLFEADWKASAPKEEIEKDEQPEKDDKERAASPAA